MNADGSAQRRLTRVHGDRSPAWSPRGNRLAFTRREEIYVMAVDGSGLRRLTRNRLPDDHAAWSPDGRKLVFTRWPANGSDGGTAIYTMNDDGREQRRLTPAKGFQQPAWSPVGQTIAFVDWIEGGIFRMSSDGSRRVRVGARDAQSFSWSPDARLIAFTRHPAIYVMNADGTSQRRIVPRPGRPLFSLRENWTPAWAPTPVR